MAWTSYPNRIRFKDLQCIVLAAFAFGLIESIPSSDVPSSPPSNVSASESIIDFENSPCPQILGCYCENNTDPTSLACDRISHFHILEIVTHYPDLKRITIQQWNEDRLYFPYFIRMTKLEELVFLRSKFTDVISGAETWPSLKNLTFYDSPLDEPTLLCNILRVTPELDVLELTKLQLTVIPECIANNTIRILRLSQNQLTALRSFPASLQELDLSENLITEVVIPEQIVKVNLAFNPLMKLGPATLTNLTTIDLSSIGMESLPTLNAPKLEQFVMQDNQLIYVDLTNFITPKLRSLLFGESPKLELVYGSLPKGLKDLSIADSKLTQMPRNFFKNNQLVNFELSSNNWNCDACSYRWTSQLKNIKGLAPFCSKVTKPDHNCDYGCSATRTNYSITYGDHVLLHCGCHASPDVVHEWYLYRPRTLLGSFDPATGKTTYPPIKNATKLEGLFKILPYGLLFPKAERALIERYVCVLKNPKKPVTYHISSLRLNYSSWYTGLFTSVIWGSLLASLAAVLISLIFNVLWIASRESILWWIKRAERLSRVRKMVEAMEKYRTRQMEALHEAYSRKVENVRENYHAQVEQLRQSYTNQTLKFRDFRDAKMENVTAHWDNMRENYGQQMHRIREYGSRRAEMLMESYERQMNRMRMFTLQQRLRVMRQYKVKQRYLNKLLESVQESSHPELIRKKEEEVRKVLEDLKEAELHGDLHDDLPEEINRPSGRFSRSSSYHSLPEFVFREDGSFGPGPFVPEGRSNTIVSYPLHPKQPKE
ncbi:unnamed protein product, partial [Mesorhabditis spiculigera]